MNIHEMARLPAVRIAGALTGLTLAATGAVVGAQHQETLEVRRASDQVQQATLELARMTIALRNAQPDSWEKQEPRIGLPYGARILHSAKDAQGDTAKVGAHLTDQTHGDYRDEEIETAMVWKDYNDGYNTSYDVTFENLGRAELEDADAPDDWVMTIIYTSEQGDPYYQSGCYGPRERCHLTEDDFERVRASAFKDFTNAMANVVERTEPPVELS